MVLDAEVLRSLVSGFIASVVNAALPPTVGPAKAIRDRNFVALVVTALGTPTVAPAESLGFCALRAVIDATFRGSSCRQHTACMSHTVIRERQRATTKRTMFPAHAAMLGTRVAVGNGAFLAALYPYQKQKIDNAL